MLKRSQTCCGQREESPYPAGGQSGAPFLSLQFWELELAVDGSGPSCVLRLGPSSPTFSVGSSPAPRVVGEGLKVPCRARREQPADIPPLLQGQDGPGSSRARGAVLWRGPCLWYCTQSLLPPCPGAPALAEGRGGLFPSPHPYRGTLLAGEL